MALSASRPPYTASFDTRVSSTIAEAAHRVPAFARRLAAAGLRAEELADAASLDRLPILTKDELLELQAAEPPFGGLLAADAHVRRMFQSPGPLYEVELAEADRWRMSPALEAAGFGAGDVVLNTFGYHLSPAGAMFEEAALALGATVVPAGVGSLELQARACRDLGVTALVGVPSYLKALLEKAEALGLEPAAWPLERAFVAAEPFPPSLRAWLEERIPVVREGYGTAEAGNLGYECDERDGLHVPDDAFVQVCDLTTGAARWDGGEGQVVVTLFSTDYPLVRFGTGDLSAFRVDVCPCGRATPRLVGWLGRVGEAVKVRGMFLHPRQAQAALADLPGLNAFRLVVDRVEHRDAMRCEVVARDGTDGAGLSTAVKERIRSALRFDADVALVEALEDGPVLVDGRRWE